VKKRIQLSQNPGWKVMNLRLYAADLIDRYKNHLNNQHLDVKITASDAVSRMYGEAMRWHRLESAIRKLDEETQQEVTQMLEKLQKAGGH